MFIVNTDSIAFDLGCNFDYALFDAVEQFDKKHSIRSFFGKLKNDGLPGGRNAAIIPDFTYDQLADYVKECKKHDIQFNYLINPLGMDQYETDPVIGKKIRQFLHDAYDLGIRAFTLNSPLLIKYAKNEFKDIFITLGLYAYPSTIQSLEYWRNCGVDEITLDHCFNRRFDVHKSVLKQYKNTDPHLRVIANNLCLRECPFRLAHGTFVGHSDPNLMSMDYSLINCAYKKVTHPAAILTSEWIRPEDVHYYRELAEETGFKNFSLKLVDRTRATPFLVNVVRAYMSESYDGNLLDLVNWPQNKAMAHIPNGKGNGQVGRPPMNIKNMELLNPVAMAEYGRTMNLPQIYVDNKKLDGFLEHFINNHGACENNLCMNDILENGETAPNACGHCSAWAKKVISYDENEVAQWKKTAESVLQNLQNGTIYKDA